jgi:hypothetical protein
MPETPGPGPVETSRRRKGLLAFYVGTGVVVLVLVGFWFAWTPLKVWYWERQVRRAPGASYTAGPDGWKIALDLPRTQAARALADLGPSSEMAFRRLLNSRNSKLNGYVLKALNRPEDSWALPMLVDIAKHEDLELAEDAIYAAQRIAGESFFPPQKGTGDISDIPLGGIRKPKGVEPARVRLLAWWNREGRARYGRRE